MYGINLTFILAPTDIFHKLPPLKTTAVTSNKISENTAAVTHD